MNNTLSNAAAYVGTYGKYGAGSLAGKWLKFADFADYGEFMNACRELHKDEDDPEFMFQDFDNCEYLRGLVGEGGISPRIWEFNDAAEDADMDAVELTIFALWCDRQGVNLSAENDYDGLIADFREANRGAYESEEAFAEELMNEIYTIPDYLANYIDYEAFARDLFMSDYEYIDGYVFDVRC